MVFEGTLLEMWGGLAARAGPAARQKPDLGVRLRTKGPPHVSMLVGAGLPASILAVPDFRSGRADQAALGAAGL